MTAINIQHEERKFKEYIDRELRECYRVMDEAIKVTIPYNNLHTVRHPEISKKQNELQRRFSILQRNANRFGWTQAGRIT